MIIDYLQFGVTHCSTLTVTSVTSSLVMCLCCTFSLFWPTRIRAYIYCNCFTVQSYFIYELLNFQSCKLANLPNQKFSRSQFSLYFISPILSTHVKTLKWITIIRFNSIHEISPRTWRYQIHSIHFIHFYMYGSISSVIEWFLTGIVWHNMWSTHPQWTVSSRDWTHIDTIWTSKADELPGPSTIKFKFKFIDESNPCPTLLLHAVVNDASFTVTRVTRTQEANLTTLQSVYTSLLRNAKTAVEHWKTCIHCTIEMRCRSVTLHESLNLALLLSAVHLL